MRPCLRLATLQKAACRRLEKLDELANDLAFKRKESTPLQLEANICFLVIELLSTWSNFARSYYLSCAYGTKLASGTRVSLAGPSLNENQALGKVVQRRKPKTTPNADGSWNRKDEPGWNDPSVFLNACKDIGCSNIADIQAALSSGSRVFSDLPTFRNYYAHRNRHTCSAAVSLARLYGISPTGSPSTILLTPSIGRSQVLILDWIDDLVFTVQYLCS